MKLKFSSIILGLVFSIILPAVVLADNPNALLASDLLYSSQTDKMPYISTSYDQSIRGQLKSQARALMIKGSNNITKYGYDFVSYQDKAAGIENLRVRGGFNRLSKDATAGVQVIVQW